MGNKLPSGSLADRRRRWARVAPALVCLVVLAVVVVRALPITSRESSQDVLPVIDRSWVSPTEPISPVPPAPQQDARKVALGKRLFNDVRLSTDNTISCASCHQLSKGGADGHPTAKGLGGNPVRRNSPTVFNSQFNFRQTWDGREETLEDQVDGPVLDPLEMGSSWPEVLGKLRADPDYVALFFRIYSDGIQVDNIKNAIASFERTLVTPNSRFDAYLKGDDAALTAEELAGYQLFKDYGCISCHQGVNVGGNTFARLGVVRDIAGSLAEDLGRYEVTGREEDRYVFKVPSLRMAAHTAPYMHNGSVGTLEGAIGLMGTYQLGVEIPEADKARIAAFIHTLSGEYSEPSE